jgi:predicted lipoprotein with Yx(FWY)xxD motif
VDSKGMTLYMFTKDEADKSNCSGGCLKAWPPLLADGAPTAGEGVDAAQLGTAALADGTKIVTYNHMPLYYWAKDTKPGDTTGQGVNDVWYVVAPDGKPVGMPAAASTLMVAKDPILGSILVDGKGMTLYMFTKDEPDKSNCSGGCLAAWPPFLADGAPVAGAGVDSTLIGTAALPDGTKILTYNHMPLYYWAADLKPGDTSGQGVNSVWYVVAPDGKPVGMPQSSVNPYGSDY